MPHPNILLPSWHLEDIARDLKEQEAAAVLNGYGLVLHPWVLAACHTVPRWTAAASPGEIERDRIVILPEPSRSKLPSGWIAQAEEQGVILLTATADRAETLAKLRSHPRLRELLGEQPTDTEHAEDIALLLETPPDQEETFLALGTVYLLTLLLSQAMYHYDNIDETRFTDFLLEAARAAMRQDSEQTSQMLRQACEQLLESREKFYPVDAHLIDLCLLSEAIPPEDVGHLTETDHVVNLFCLGDYLDSLAEQHPEALAQLKAGVETEKLSLLGGEQTEASTPLLPIQAARWQIQQGLATSRRHLGVEPAVWMRMRFGLSTQLPLLCDRFGLTGAYHLVLDDGLYPDEEQSHFAWEGRSGSVIQSISRIPLSVENATSLLRIPERMAEAMNHDHLASVVLARWPKLRNPWYRDIVHVQKLVPILGRFSRLDQFLQETEHSGHQSSHEQRLYLTPDLAQITGRKGVDPLSRFVRYWQWQTRAETLAWMQAVTQLLGGQVEGAGKLLEEFQQASADLADARLPELAGQLEQQLATTLPRLTERLTAGGRAEPGVLVLNPLSHTRLVSVEIPDENRNGTPHMPRLQEAVKHLQRTEHSTLAVVEVPACGFAALEWQPVEKFRPPRVKAPLAGEFFLQNEFFQAQIDPATGGIQKLRVHGSTENLLSQRLVFRLDGSTGTVPRGGAARGGSSSEPTYTRMVADSIEVLESEAVRGRIAVHGRLLDTRGESEEQEPATEQPVVAEFRQIYTVTRGMRTLGIEIEIAPQVQPTHLVDRSYYAMRFAWGASAAKVRGVLQQSQFLAGDRLLESTGPIEIDDGDFRVALLPHFLPFHQRTGHRMLDSLLIVSGETTRTFRYDIAVDSPHASLSAANCYVPAIVQPVEHLPRMHSSWLFHLSAPNVQLLHMQPEEPQPASEESPTEIPPGCYRFDFIEVESQHAVVKFTPFRTPKQAWEIDFRGNIQSELTITEDHIQFECLPCDYLSLRVRF